MSDVILDWVPTAQRGVIKGDYLIDIRELLSVPDETARFRRYRNRFVSSRKYVITPTGRFESGLTAEILKTVRNNFPDINVKVTDELANVVRPKYTSPNISPLNLELRDYQEEAVRSCLDVG